MGGCQGHLELPYPGQCGLKLLRIMLDSHWLFEAHIRELQGKAIKGLASVRRVANTVWEMEGRILSIPTRPIVGSLADYSLAVVGIHCSQMRMG